MSKLARFVQFSAAALKKHDFPRVVNYDITSRCNLECEHCYWKKTYDSAKELSDETWIKTFKEHRARGANTAYLTGGEPTLRPRLIEAADKIFPSMMMVSNGVIRVDPKIRRRIAVSVDGPAEIHNKIRRADVFQKVMANIKNDKRVILAPTLTTTNYHYVSEIVDIARDSGVAGVTFSTYTSHRGQEDPLLLQGEKLDWTINKLLALYRRNKDIILITPYMLKSWSQKKYHRNCFFTGKSFIAFDANLNIKKPCTLGAGVKCDTCGCVVPVFAYALKHLDVASWLAFDRFFPAEFVGTK